MAKVLSMEIGSSMIKIVEMDFKTKKPRIYKCVEAKTPEGAVNDGYLDPAKMEALRAAIYGALRENKIRTRRVVFTLFSGKIICREIMTPAVKEHQIGAVVETNANEYFPIELDNYKVAHSLIQSFHDGENEGRHKVFVMAAERDIFVPYERLAAALGLYLIDIDYAGNSMVQAARQSAGDNAIVAVKAENEYALITILRQGTMIMQRTVNYAVGRGYNAISDEEETNAVLTGTVTRLIDYYMANNEENKVGQIFLMGEGSRSQALLDRMAEQTGVQCRLLDNVRSAAATSKVADVHISVFAAAIGAGVKSVGFDEEKEKERHETNYASASFLMIILFIVVAVALMSISLIPYNAALIEQASLEKKQQQLAPAKAVHDQYLGLKDFIGQLRYGNALTQRFNDGIVNFFEELEKKLPETAEMTDFSSDDEQCVMTISVGDKETAAGIILMLRSFESLESVAVESIVEEVTEDTAAGIADEMLKGNNVKKINFTVTCRYRVSVPEAPVPSIQPPNAAADADAQGANANANANASLAE